MDRCCYVSSSTPLGLVLCTSMALGRERRCFRCCLEEDRRGTSDQGKKLRCLTSGWINKEPIKAWMKGQDQSSAHLNVRVWFFLSLCVLQHRKHTNDCRSGKGMFPAFSVWVCTLTLHWWTTYFDFTQTSYTRSELMAISMANKSSILIDTTDENKCPRREYRKIICVVFCDNVVESINWTASCEWYWKITHLG